MNRFAVPRQAMENLLDIETEASRRYCGNCRTTPVEHITLTPEQGKAYGRYGYDLDYFYCPKCGTEQATTYTLLDKAKERGSGA